MVLLVLGGLCTGCDGDAIRSCLEPLEAERFDEAAARCAAMYEETDDPRAAEAAVRAAYGSGDRDGVLDWRERLRGTPAEARAQALAARVLLQDGETTAAIEAFERAATLDRRGGRTAEAAKSVYGLFYIAWDEGAYGDALANAYEAAELAGEAGDPALETTALSGIYSIHYELGDLAGARAAAQRARELDDDEAYWLASLGTIQLDEGRPALARQTLEQVLEVATGEEDRRFFRSTHLNLVRANLELGELATARRHLEAAWRHTEPEGREQSALLSFEARLAMAEDDAPTAFETAERALAQDPHDDWRWELATQKGEAALALGEVGVARRAFDEAVTTIESMRTELGQDDLKPWLLAKRRAAFERLFLLDARSGRVKQALETVERARARTFLEAYVTALATHDSARSSAPDATEEPAAAMSERLDTFEAFRSPATLHPADELLAALGDRQVWVFFRAVDSLWRFDVRDGQIGLERLETTAAELSLEIDRLLADPDDEATATRLAEQVLPSLPSAATRFHVVADLPLDRLPFALLRVDGRPLVMDHEIVYVPSLEALATSRPPRSITSPPLVLGDPLGDLASARKEAEAVAAKLGVSAWLGEAATRERLAEARTASVLHLASHGELGTAGPSLVLADGRLRVRDVLDRRLAPRLVVLASCVGATRRGLGTWESLGAAFLGAGTDHVLAALWSVDDVATAELMVRFYDREDDPVTALTGAQREAIRAGEPAARWAPFVVLGTGGER